jgi:hypothetical protein
MKRQADVPRPIESCWATLKDEMLVSRFGRLLTGATGQWGRTWWAAGSVVQLPNGALETRSRYYTR